MPALPTHPDVTSYLSERYGVTVSGTDSITDLLAAAAEEVQSRTGYRPFIAAAGTHRVRVTGRRVALPNAVVTLTSVTANTLTYTEGLDFDRGPLSGPRIQWLEWLRGAPSVPVTIAGTFGYGAEYPADLWLAIVQLVAGRVIDGLITGKIADTGASWTDGDVSESYGAIISSSAGKGEQGSLAGSEIDRALTTIDRYRRVVGFG